MTKIGSTWPAPPVCWGSVRIGWVTPVVEVVSVTVVDVDAEKRVDDSLVQIWKLKFGQKVNFLFRL